MGDGTEFEPVQRLDGSWGVAISGDGAREIVGVFETQDDAARWIQKAIKALDDEPSKSS